MTEEREFLILGAGPTGLGAGYRLDTQGQKDWLICEGSTRVGGLAGSVIDPEGFTWDLGGHVQFSHYSLFDELMDELLGKDGWLHHERSSWVWMRGRFIPYPFQLNLRYLPPADLWDAVRGLLRLRDRSLGEPQNFAEWIEQSFGDGISRIFLRPYNWKVWAHPLEELSWQWIGDRVATIDFERVLANVLLARDDIGWGPNNRFRFPREGGTGEVWRRLAARLDQPLGQRIRLEREMVRLDTESKTAFFANGESIRYSRLLSTIPLDELVRRSDLAPRLGEALLDLRYSATHVIGVGLKGRPPSELEGKCWMYFPEDDCPFYRVTVFSHYSPNNVPDIRKYWSLMAEVSESPCKPVDAGRVVEETIQGMLNTGLIPGRDALHHSFYRRLARGYPTPSLHRDRGLSILNPVLEERDVFSRGRFGAWKYEVSNQDHSFAQGVELVDRWLSGTAEETLDDPERVNRRRPKDTREPAVKRPRDRVSHPKKTRKT